MSKLGPIAPYSLAACVECEDLAEPLGPLHAVEMHPVRACDEEEGPDEGDVGQAGRGAGVGLGPGPPHEAVDEVGEGEGRRNAHVQVHRSEGKKLRLNLYSFKIIKSVYP